MSLESRNWCTMRPMCPIRPGRTSRLRAIGGVEAVRGRNPVEPRRGEIPTRRNARGPPGVDL